MNEFKEPTRWSDAGSDAPAELRVWLNAAQKDLPGEASLQALGLVAPLAPPPPLAGPEAGALAQGAKVGATLSAGKVLTVVAVLAGGAALFALSLEPPAPVKPKPSSAAVESVVAEAPSVAAPPVETATPEPSVSATSAALPSAPPAIAANVSELGLLRQARVSLSAQPQRALELLQRHQREFPNSNFEQERDVIRIEALRRLGRTAEAARLSEAFERKFPDSAHKNRLERGAP